MNRVTPPMHAGVPAGDPADHDGYDPLAVIGLALAAMALGFVGVEAYRRGHRTGE